MIDLNTIGEYITRKELWGRAFGDLSQGEMQDLCFAILEAVNHESGFEPPRIEKGGLIIPVKSPMKYRWWAGGQSIEKTLDELGASDEIKAKYIPTNAGKGILKH